MDEQPKSMREAHGLRSLSFTGIEIELSSRRVFVDGVEVSLTFSEFELLRAMASNAGAVIPAEQLSGELWGTSWIGEGHALEVQVSRLRAKLGESSRHPRFIHTVRSVGYRFEAKALLIVTLVYDALLRVISVEPADRPFFGWVPAEVVGTFFILAAGPLGQLSQSESVAIMRSVAKVGPLVSSTPYEVRCADGSTELRTALLEVFVDEHSEFAGARTVVS